MKNRWMQLLMGGCIVLLLSGGVFYMLKQQKTKRVKDQYDVYMAQLDAYVEKNGLPLLTEDTTKYDVISDKVEEARNYLMKHSPHLLTPEEDSEELYSREAYIAYLRKEDPEAAANLEAELAEVAREYEAGKARIDAEADGFEQEYLDHQAHMADFAKKREAWQQERLADAREHAAFSKRLDSFIDELRSHLKFDESGKVIGIRDDSIFSESESPSVVPRHADDPDVPVDVPDPTDDALDNPPVETPAPVGASPTDNPQLWRERFKTEMAGIHTGFYEKYPDVMIRPHLTDTEYETFFPDAVSRQNLEQRTEALQTAYATRIRAVYEKTPRQQQKALLEMAREALSTQWDRDFSDAVIKRLEVDDN